MENISRKYPILDLEVDYKNRYTHEDFEKHAKITKSLGNYEKWKNGINYETNRKIKVGGKTHQNLGYDNFYIKHDLFTKLDGIDVDLYIRETDEIKKKVQERNKEIQERNKEINDTICKINLLENWEEYVTFEENKYGIPNVYNNIHRENNCLGSFVKDSYDSCNCRTCENWGGCSNPKGTQYYKCVKCGYKHSITIEFSNNHYFN
jgi:hypothetical protein